MSIPVDVDSGEPVEMVIGAKYQLNRPDAMGSSLHQVDLKKIGDNFEQNGSPSLGPIGDGQAVILRKVKVEMEFLYLSGTRRKEKGAVLQIDSAGPVRYFFINEDQYNWLCIK